MKILLAGLAHETHTFVEDRTRLADFQILLGAQMWRANGDCTPLAGALQIAVERDWNVVPALDMKAMPGGIVDDEVINFWWAHIAKTLAAHAGLDGVFLLLHGAMVSQTLRDVEGEMLRRIRAHMGPQIPIGGVTDLHANFSQAMADNSNALLTFRENPHTDTMETASRAARLFDDILHSRKIPRTFWAHPPIVWQPAGTATVEEPMRSLETLARELEADFGILAANVHAGFAFADTPDCGVSFTIIATDENEAQSALAQLAELAMQNRELGNPPLPTLDEVMPHVKKLLARDVTPILLVEPADNIGGGAPGDDTAILQALLENNIENSAVAINDARAVEALWNLPIGSSARLAIGGTSALGNGPLPVELEIVSRSDGEFQLEDEHSHMAALSGRNVDMGRCVVARCAGVTILLTSRKTPPMDLGQWRSQNLAPETLSVIGVKAAVAHRQAYDPIAAASFSVRTPGPCAADLSSLPFRFIRRPIYPLD